MTDIEIVNLALSDCGQRPIISFDDGSPAAIQAKTKYGAIRDAVLECREWTFAKSRMELSEDANAPLFGYAHQYVIPSPVLRVVHVYDPSGVAAGRPLPVNDWVREGQRVLTDRVGPIYAEVLGRVPEGQFSPGMAMALAARLTSVFAIPLTENRQLAKDFMDGYNALLTDAAAMDGSQGRTQRLRPPPLPGRRQTL